jgi:hypothetical protein
VIAFAIMLLAAATGFTGDATRWLNVHVVAEEEEANVEVRLPLELVLTVINGIKVEGFDAGKVDLEIDDAEIDWPAILKAIKEVPDGDFVKVDSRDANVRVSKQAGMMLIHVDEIDGDNAKVDVSLPMQLIDAVNIDEDNRIDIRALLEGIDGLPNGELVKVTSDEADVRIWVE